MPRKTENKSENTVAGFAWQDGWKRAAAAVAALLLVPIVFLAGWFGHYFSLDEEVRTFLWAKSVAERNYYLKLDEDEIYTRMYGALRLDNYSVLYPPADYEAYRAEGEGKMYDYGLSFLEENANGVYLPRVYLQTENSPASCAGVREGMYVFAFGKTEDSLQTGGLYELTAFAREQDGAFVARCGFSPDGSDAALYPIVSKPYQAAYCFYRDSETGFRFRYEGSVSGKTVPDFLTETGEPLKGLDGKSAYIRINDFYGYCAEEFQACLDLMKRRGRTELILDLRSNGGGYLDKFSRIAGLLLRDGEGAEVVARAIYRNGDEKQYIAESDFSRLSPDSRVLVLADEYSASATECLIGAMVDHGTISYSDLYLRRNGEGVAKTFGKGIMQSSFTNVNGAAMKLTVAKICWPSGKSIHGVGVTEADGCHAVSSGRCRCGFSDPLLEAAIADLCD